MRNVISYVLRCDKVREGFVDITGPYNHDSINWDKVYQVFLHEKRLWNKDSGRMYAHNIISFHRDESVTPEECMRIGKAFADQFFPEHQTLISIHQDKNHLHIHLVTNSVSFVNGRKLHQTKHDLDRQKEYTNALCRELGLSVTEKGKHFDGTSMAKGEICSWNKDKYNLLRNETKKSFVADCAIAILECVSQSASRDEFIRAMTERGWSVKWQDSRKHIVFENKAGQKIRDGNISKTFNLNIGKESLIHEFERQAALRSDRIRAEQESRELDRYYADIESALTEADVAIRGARQDPGSYKYTFYSESGTGRGTGEEHKNTESNFYDFLSELGSEIKDSKNQRRAPDNTGAEQGAERRKQKPERQQYEDLFGEHNIAIKNAGNAIDNSRARKRTVINKSSESKDYGREQRLANQPRPNDIESVRRVKKQKRRSKNL